MPRLTQSVQAKNNPFNPNEASQSLAALHGFPIGVGNDEVGEGGGHQAKAATQASPRFAREGAVSCHDAPRRLTGAEWLSAFGAVLALLALLAACAGAPVQHDGFQDPVAIAATPDGAVWVLDAGTGEVVVLQGGVVTRRIGGSGTGDDAFLDPVDLDPTNGQTLFVADRAGGAVVRVTAEGRVAQQIPVPDLDPAQPLRQSLRSARRGQPIAVVAAPDGGLYVVDGGRRHVLHLDAEGNAQRVLGAGLLSDPVDLAVADDGTLWVADAGRSLAQSFDRFGAPGEATNVSEANGRIVGIAALGSRVAFAQTRALVRGVGFAVLPQPAGAPDLRGLALLPSGAAVVLSADGVALVEDVGEGDAVRD